MAAAPVENTSSKPSELPAALRECQGLLAAGRAKEAFQVLNSRGLSGVQFQNARAVCLLRLNDPAAAVAALRTLVMEPGALAMRADVPILFQINFATALAMSGNVLGAVRIMNGIEQPDDPRLQELRQAVAQWEKTLTFWEWIQWCGGVSIDRPLSIGFVPGSLV
jgi:hypothetical protein